MRFAIFSDIHANLQAWQAVLDDIRDQQVDTLVCLGDVVGYGPMPGPVLESVYQHTDNFVLGNHDAVVGGRIDAATFNKHARYVIEWTADQLGDEGAAFFAQVPLTLRGEKMLFTHGDVARPGHFDYVVRAEDARPSFLACKDDVIFFGHTHEPGVFACASNKGIIDKLPGVDVELRQGRRYMINPGSVGDPRSARDLRASYCVYDSSTRRLMFRRVAFDVEGYRADLVASGLAMTPYFLRVIDAGSRRPEEAEAGAAVQDHRGEVEVDESLAVKPRALVTHGSPMANRAKLRFGFSQPAVAQPHPNHFYPAPPPRAGAVPGAVNQSPHGVAPVPVKRRGMMTVVVGVLVGLCALIFVIIRFSAAPRAERADSSEGSPAGGRGGLLSDEGWEDPGDGTSRRKVSAVAPGPILSLSSLVDSAYDRLNVVLPAGVELLGREGGGQLLKFGSGPSHVEIPAEALRTIRMSSVSAAVWIRVSPADHDRLIFGRQGDGEDALQMAMTITSDKHEKPGCIIFGDGGKSVGSARSSSQNRIDDGDWHLVIGMYEREAQRLRIYIDGKKSKEANGSSTFGRMAGPVLVGGGAEGFGPFEGEIYGLRFFAWALRDRDALKLFETGE